MTLYIAIWGALIGTFTFVWNLLKWYQEKPRIVASVEAVESLWTEDDFAGIRLKIRNRGGKRTTLEAVFFYERIGWFEYFPQSVLFRLAGVLRWRHNLGSLQQEINKFPQSLDINASWEGFVQFELQDPDDDEEVKLVDMNRDLAKRLKTGRVRFAIQCSHTNRLVRGQIKGEDDRLKM